MRGPPLSLKARALQWLAQREHSRLELRRKLLRLARQRAAALAAAAAVAADSATNATEAAEATDATEAPRPSASELAAEVEALLDWLQAKHFLSDARFVESRVNARAARYGNLRIRLELSQHGAVLDADTAGSLKDSEFARAHAVWLRKYGSSPSSLGVSASIATLGQERARQMRFLAGRGFSAEAIRRVLRGGPSADDDAG